jgi:multicomponent K+:H+ antiporter subunit A
VPLTLSILLLLAGAALPALLGRLPGLTPARVAGLVCAGALALLLLPVPAVMQGGVHAEFLPWLGAVGLDWSLRMDGYGLLFALLVCGLGLLVIVYAAYYLGGHEPRGRFFGLLLLFMASMLGVVLAGNLLLLVLFWEMTGLSSFLLIGFWRDQEQARQGARLALFVTGAGGLALLGGALLLGHIVGSYELDRVLASGDQIRGHALYPVALVLVLAGAFSKSAQFPFHFWLPHAMAAPTPVSAYLHSAAMVKAGVYLLGRLHPALSGTETWFWLVAGAGAATLLLGSFIALYRHDLKGLLAYSTISHLGLITLLFGMDRPLATVAAVFHIVNHAVFKASLFMSAGIIDHETGTRDMRRLGGLARLLPRTTALAVIAAAAMAGVPLLNGFLSKEMFFQQALEVGGSGLRAYALPLLATLASVFTVAYSARFVHDVFFGAGPRQIDRVPHEPPVWMSVPVGLLAVLCLAVGLAPALIVGPLLEVAAGSLLPGPVPEFSLAVWHGFNLPLAMSLVALAGGAALYFARRFVFDLHSHVPSAFNGRALTERIVQRLTERSRWLLASIDDGTLRRYLLWLVAGAALAGFAGFSGSPLSGTAPRQPVDVAGIAGLALMGIAAMATAAWHGHRVRAVIALAVCGLMVTLAFARLSSPDLALTQLLVEMASLLLLLGALRYFPQRVAEPASPRRLRDLLLAGAGGGGIGLLCFAMLTRPFTSISGYYLDEARPAAGGYNVVNVILVDFRGYDTLGEVTVLLIAAVAVLAMLRSIEVAEPPGDGQGGPVLQEQPVLMLQQAARALLPLALLLSVYLFLRGHNAPGGGFIGGLVAALAIAMLWLARGLPTDTDALRRTLTWLLSLGLLCAALTGVGSFAFNAPFLTSAFGHAHVSVLGEIELATVLFFDLGVFLVVVGMVLAVLAAVGQLSRPPAERL